jgi:hypothetical protein
MCSRWQLVPGMPPTVFVKDTDSLEEQIQRAFPETKMVKAQISAVDLVPRLEQSA